MEKENKCNKYEGLFIFQDEKAFYEHLENCPDCQEEHKKLLKVSKLVKEAAPVYLKKRSQKTSAIKRLACCLVVFIGLTSFTGYKVYDNYMYELNSSYDSYITAMGLPTDDYGFLDL